MADITLTCAACGKTLVISEFAVQKEVPCPACGAALAMPQTQTAPRIKLRPPPPPPVIAPPAAPPSPATVPVSANRRQFKFLKRDMQRVQRSKWLHYLSWVWFLVLTALLYYLRFRNGCAAYLTLEQLKLYGLIAIGVVYLLSIIGALRDNMFDGLLAIVVPFYSFYHLFLVSGNIFLRAAAGAFLLVFGLDLLHVLQEWANQMFNAVNYWIRNA